MGSYDTIRQGGLLADDLVQNASVEIIGVGGIGAVTALTLAKMGFGRKAPMDLWDPDVVEQHNVPTQLFGPPHIGAKKVRALAQIIRELTGTQTLMHPNMWEPGSDARIVICGVDSLRARKEIWARLRNRMPEIYIDARMGALVANIYAVKSNLGEAYDKTLEGEPIQEPCTARATFFTGAGIAAAVGSLLFRHLRKESVPFETLIDWGKLAVL